MHLLEVNYPRKWIYRRIFVRKLDVLNDVSVISEKERLFLRFGSIAALLANAGWQVWLLDVAGSGDDKKARNTPAQAGLARVIGSKPPLLFLPEYAARIHVGNVEDDLNVMGDADWVVEAVVENMDARKRYWRRLKRIRGRVRLSAAIPAG